MSGPQFGHIQTFSRKPNPIGQSVDQILAELERDPAYSTHVDDPKPPVHIDGVTIPELRANHAEMIANAGTTVLTAKGEEHVRAIRKDRHTLMTMIVSYPLTLEQIGDDPEELERLETWRCKNIEFARKQWGEGYQCAVEHTDEAHPHLHMYGLPLDVYGVDAKTMHPGKRAKAHVESQAKGAGKAPKDALKMGNAAYRAAMQGWQDEYHRAVGEPCGLLRVGPKRQRLTRAEYLAQKRVARLNSESSLVAEREQLDRRMRIQTRWDVRCTARIERKLGAEREQLDRRVRIQTKWDARCTARIERKLDHADELEGVAAATVAEAREKVLALTEHASEEKSQAVRNAQREVDDLRETLVIETRDAHADIGRRKTELDARGSELDRRADQLEKREAGLRRRGLELDAFGSRLDQRADELDARESAIRQRIDDINPLVDRLTRAMEVIGAGLRFLGEKFGISISSKFESALSDVQAALDDAAALREEVVSKPKMRVASASDAPEEPREETAGPGF